MYPGRSNLTLVVPTSMSMGKKPHFVAFTKVGWSSPPTLMVSEQLVTRVQSDSSVNTPQVAAPSSTSKTSPLRTLPSSCSPCLIAAALEIDTSCM